MLPQSKPEFDITKYLRPGDRIVWGQACAEPRTLVEFLVARRHELAGTTCFLGVPARDTVIRVEHADALRFVSYCGAGSNRVLHAAGVLEIVPAHYSDLPDLLSTGALRADVVFVQVSPPDSRGEHSLGLGDDYLSAALDTARVLLAEVNDQVPFTAGARTLTAADWHGAVYTSRPPAQLPPAAGDDTARAVAARVAELIPDGATLQFGIGSLPELCLLALRDHRDLGIHSGLFNEPAMQLMREGVVTGARKSRDRGVAVAGLIVGTPELFGFVHDNPRVEVRDTAYTHGHQVLADHHQFVAVNSALEVDLTGQVNCESVGGRYVGAVGGATDFLRGARASRGGLPIVALPSTAGSASRIVDQLGGPVGVHRGDVGLVVTEHGVADLRGATLSQRRERMLAITHPQHRESLAAQVEHRRSKESRP